MRTKGCPVEMAISEMRVRRGSHTSHDDLSIGTTMTTDLKIRCSLVIELELRAQLSVSRNLSAAASIVVILE